MPAYRSSAEAEVRDAVVAQLRLLRPGARMIHEINVSTYGGVRMDLICVSEAEIIAVEVKSARDKLDRLAKQIKAMHGCAHHVIAALHEKHLVERETNFHQAHVDRDGKFYFGDAPPEARGAEVWVYPQRRRMLRETGVDFIEKWKEPGAVYQVASPPGAIHLLWREELAWLCGHLGVALGRTTRMDQMVAALRWNCSGAEITRGVCAALRRRQCIEADAPINSLAAKAAA